MTDTTSGGTVASADTYATACEYVNAGLFVFPVTVTRDASGKKTVRPHGEWRKLSSDRLTDVEHWWGPQGIHRTAGILVDTGKSRLVVVDPDGQEGIGNWAALDPPKPLWIVRTPGGGEHWYYRASDDHVIGNDQSGRLAEKVDVRGVGGFVIAPPTFDGAGRWVAEHAPDWTADAVAPAVVIERMTAKAPALLQDVKKGDEGADAFDDVKNERRFTRAQAEEFIRTELEKLKAAQSGFNGAINNFAMACAHFPWLISERRCAAKVQKHLGERLGWPDSDRNDLATIRSAYSATETGGSWVAVEVPETATPTAASPNRSADDDTRPDILPPPARPYDVARELLGWIAATGGAPHRAWWRDDFYAWTGAHWEVWETAEVERWLYRMTGDATYLVPAKKEGGEIECAPWAPTRKRIGDLAHALGVGMLQRTGDEEQVLAVTNGVVDPHTRTVVPHDPRRFNLSSLPFAYEADAECPEWLKFLDSSLPGDRQAHETLAEWFGYVLSGRTDLHKIGVLVGPPRCGKGTISRVLQAMVGPQGWAAPTLARLGSEFGLASLIGRKLAVMGDVRWTSKHVIEAVPIMLGVSGEDGFTVPRKHVGDWIGKLGARLMLMSNDAPMFTDASGALAGRMVYVAFQHSFLGREDLELEGRLMQELPGILNWALGGLERLNHTGVFTQSVASEELRGEVDRDSSPVKAWVEDQCVLDPEAQFTLEALLERYRDWLDKEHMQFSPSLNRLSRDIRSAFGDKGVVVERKPNGVGGKHRVVSGIRPLAGATITDSDLFD